MSAEPSRQIVLTGGPGSGKTTLADQFSRQNIRIYSESGRAVLQASGGSVLRDADPKAYALMMLHQNLRNWEKAVHSSGTCVFDRGFPDIMGYLNLENMAIPDQLATACKVCRYTGPIFAAPPWEDIYANDDERTQDFKTACRTFDEVVRAWLVSGYDLIELPRASAEDRVAFILSRLS